MTLADIEVSVGVIVDVDDPEFLGRIRVTAPGVFDSDEMGIEFLPWVAPLTINYQNYSKMNKGNKVWLFHNSNNYFEYWYLPFLELNDATRKLIDNRNTDILISRQGKNGTSQLYYKDESGMHMTSGNAEVNVNASGAINITGNGNVLVSGDCIQLTNKNTELEPVALGTSTGAAIETIAKGFQAISKEIANNPFCANLAETFNDTGNKILAEIEKIKSSSVYAAK